MNTELDQERPVSDVVLPKRRRRGIKARVLGGDYRRGPIEPEREEIFDELAAHDVDAHAEMLTDDTMYVDFEVSAGPERGASARMTVWAQRGPWWAPWRTKLGVRVECDR